MGGGTSSSGNMGTDATNIAGGNAHPSGGDINQANLEKFIQNTAEGRQFQGQYAALIGGANATANQGLQFNTTSGSVGVATRNAQGTETDITAMMHAYDAWNADQTNTQQTWQNYATLVAQQAGGEGQSTILGTPSTALGASKSSNFNQTIIGGVKR